VAIYRITIETPKFKHRIIPLKPKKRERERRESGGVAIGTTFNGRGEQI
jgi:hypothetical protein